MARKTAARRPAKKSKRRTKLHFFWYPLFIFLLLCAGVFLLLATFPGLADDLRITAKVSGPLVTDPAVITSPAEGTNFSSAPVTVEGTCPANAAYVEIFRNGVMSGSAICDSSANFQLSSDLFFGANSLVAHVFNLTDDEGPRSAAINVVYSPPTPSTPASGSSAGPSSPSSAPRSSSPASAAEPLTVQTPFVYKGYLVGDEVVWPLTITGGLTPYAVHVDWQDNSSTDYRRDASGSFTISHIYSSLPKSNGSFIIRVSVTDAAGFKSSIQFFVLVRSNISTAPEASIFSKPPPAAGSPRWLFYAWPAYIALLGMTISYMLGERQELLTLKNKGLLRRSGRR